jgi:TonB family protein
MAYVELGQDNGGILLNLGEGGFAVQSALALTSREFPELRFQVPAVQGWLTAGGRVVWISESNKEAGIQFTDLPGEARREIQRWVSAEGEPQKTVEQAPMTPRESSRKQILEAPYRGGGAVREPIAGSALMNGTPAQRERGPAMQPQPPRVAVAEPPAQDFHFTDYSMFAAEPAKVGAWAEPARPRGNFRRGVLGAFVALLFFVLGATVGRETVERWIADVGDWAQNQISPAPKVTAPAPPEQNAAAATTEDKAESKSEANAEVKAGDNVNASSGLTGNSDIDKGASQKPNDVAKGTSDTGEVPRTGSAVESGRAAGPMSPGATATGGSRHIVERRHTTETGVAPDSIEAGPSRMAAEHSILVNAPGPGSPPFFVNLPGEAISASGAIAISARRTLEILPRGGVGRPERVIIGKLISHSEPFYPVEARNRRIEGNVELQARVGRTGQIISVTPVSGPRLLTSPAMTAVREWRYEPTFIDGDPAETLAEITIVFRLP